MQKFSNRLISLRKERGLTQEDLAKLINKKRSTVSGYETIKRVLNYYGDDIFDNTMPVRK